MDAIDAELVHAQEERRKMEEALAAGAPMAVASVTFDTDLYGGGGSDPNRFAGYNTSIPASEEDAPEDDSEPVNPAARRLASYTGHAVAALFFVYAPLLFSVDSGPSFAERPRVAVPRASSGSGPGSEVQVRVLVSMAGGLYPLARAEALRGLAAVLEKADAGGGVVECCYGCAVELLRDDGEGVRLAAVRLIGLCVKKFAAREEVDGNGDGDQMDLIFLQFTIMFLSPGIFLTV